VAEPVEIRQKLNKTLKTDRIRVPDNLIKPAEIRTKETDKEVYEKKNGRST